MRIIASTFTLIGAGEIVTLTAFAYIYGFSGISFFLGTLIGFVSVAVLSRKIRSRSLDYKPYTITDYIREYLGSKSEKVSILLSLIAIGSLLAIQLVVGGLLISTLTGLPYIISVIVIGLVVSIYLTLGGFHSVLTTDVIQGVSMLVLVVFLVFLYNPGGSSIGVLLETSQNIIPPVDFIVLVVLGFFAIFGAADVYQRMYAARSDIEAKKGLISTGFIFLFFGIMVIILGLRIFTQFPLSDPNKAFFDFLTSGLSPVLITLLSIFIVASLFSTADTELFLSSILVGKLILGKQKLSSSVSQLLMWIIVFFGILSAIYFTSLVDIYFILLYAFMIIGPVVLARLFGRGNDGVGAVGMLVSLGMLIVFAIFNLLVGLYPLILIVPPAISFLVPSKKN
jgi:Na+/proline symporter